MDSRDCYVLILMFVSAGIAAGDRCLIPMVCDKNLGWVEVPLNNTEIMLKRRFKSDLQRFEKKLSNISETVNKLKEKLKALSRPTTIASNTSFVNGSTNNIWPTTERLITPEFVSSTDLAVSPTCHWMSVYTGQKKSGHYNMTDGDSIFQVYCNFTFGSAVTEVWHDSMHEAYISKKCDAKGCYSRIPKYTVNFKDIAKIVNSSASCKQYIKYRCQGSILFRNVSQGWWVSSGGEKMIYWGGATSRRDYYCACGETASCDDNKYKCNCDDNQNARITQDEGYLTDKSKLPVREMRFGDLGGSGEKGWHTLGKLECSG